MRLYIEQELTQEQIDFNRKWIEALRSGYYKQGKFSLCFSLFVDNYYCCLGVACKISGVKSNIENECEFFDGQKLLLPISVKHKLGMSSENGEFDESSLVLLNDRGSTFNEIASVIENELNLKLGLI